jgi:hypothetical protein
LFIYGEHAIHTTTCLQFLPQIQTNALLSEQGCKISSQYERC